MAVGVRTALLVILLSLTGSTGCARRVDMAGAVGPDQPSLTIVYTGVREESRLYPDYGPIGASILTDDPKPAKKGKSP